MSWKHLDKQMRSYKLQLASKARLDVAATKSLATTIASEVRFLGSDAKDRIKSASPVELKYRLEELQAFQEFMGKATSSGLGAAPEFVRATVVVQNYIAFVYLPESCFSILRKEMPQGTTTKRCAKYLTDNPVRSFRNAIAHANWTYSRDYSGLIYWARRGSDQNEPLVEHVVDGETLEFWQALSRCTAYAAMSNL